MTSKTATISGGPTIQSNTGDSNTTSLIAAVISTVLILLVIGTLVIIVSVLMCKRRKRKTFKISTGQDDTCLANPVYSDTTLGRGVEDMSNPNYQPQQGTITTLSYYMYMCLCMYISLPIIDTHYFLGTTNVYKL